MRITYNTNFTHKPLAVTVWFPHQDKARPTYARRDFVQFLPQSQLTNGQTKARHQGAIHPLALHLGPFTPATLRIATNQIILNFPEEKSKKQTENTHTYTHTQTAKLNNKT